MNSIYQAKQDIIEVCKRIYARGYVASNDGNVSVRISKDRVLTTPTGRSKGFLTEDQLIVCDMEGNKVSGTLSPSSEIKMHIMVYREREDINAVVHAHPVTATGFAVAGIPLAQCVLPEVVITLGGIPLAEYGTPSTEEIPNSIRQYIQDYDAFLLENHGALTIGPDVVNAYHKMETLEHFAQITLVAKQLGKINVISDGNVQKLMDVRKNLGVKGQNPLACKQCTQSCPRCQTKAKAAAENPTPQAILPEADRELIQSIAQRVMTTLSS
ncbi:MAG: class II aldolase/adducin family protein [Candidatus Latescibacterota bacterium]